LTRKNVRLSRKRSHRRVDQSFPKTNKIISPYQEPLETAVRDHELHVTDASVTHSGLWPAVKDIHPELSHLKYDQVPRARVFYNHDTEKFHVWGPKAHLENPKMQEQILSTFNLRRQKTVFEPNQDYEKGNHALKR
jgi:hypothetical protein